LNLAKCLDSLVNQDEVSFEIIVVDDHSEDETRQIAESYPQVRVLSARPLPAHWTGKANAIETAIPSARGQWLLFTDADTVHLPGSLKRSLDEAKNHGVSMLSYSPRQDVCTFWEKSIQPVVFAELNRSFAYEDINDPNSQSAAANGQYILVNRSSYEEIGGHRTVNGSLLEDVELARAMKRVGRLRFRYAPDAVSARMYRTLGELTLGWTKNLAALFPNVLGLGFIRLLESFALLLGPPLAIVLFLGREWLLTILAVSLTLVCYFRFARRLRKAGWQFSRSKSSVLGLPFFSYLLFRSYFSYRIRKTVTWKGRSYQT
jgi:glycosyltransferase involved in cell wall biosynthesis